MTRVISILGPSFCGSSLTNAVLDGLPGVAGLGESFWIRDSGRTDPPCNCGQWCERWPEGLVDTLRNCELNWIETIKAHIGGHAVVTSEKWQEIHKRFDIFPDIALIVWRDPRAWSTSWLMHRALLDRDLVFAELEPTNEEITRAAETWAKAYRGRLRWVREQRIPAVGLDLDAFTRAPMRQLERLCLGLGLEYLTQALDYSATTHHAIRGNRSLLPGSPPHRPRYWDEHRATIGRKITQDERWKKVLTKEQEYIIEEITRGMRSMLALLGG